MAQLLDDIAALHEAGAAAATAASQAAAPSHHSSRRLHGMLLPQVLLVRLQAALAARDYTQALHTLHAYYDHAQVRAWEKPCVNSACMCSFQ